MKISTLILTIIASIIFQSVSSLAFDTTELYIVKSEQTNQTAMLLPEGHSIVEVFGTNNETITCTFIDKLTHDVADMSENTDRCVSRANLKDPRSILIRVTNNTDKDIEYRIWTHDTKTNN